MRVMVIDMMGKGSEGTPQKIHNTGLRLNSLYMISGVKQRSKDLASTSRVQDQHLLWRNHVIGKGKGTLIEICYGIIVTFEISDCTIGISIYKELLLWRWALGIDPRGEYSSYSSWASGSCKPLLIDL